LDYVYLLESIAAPGERYVGRTTDLKRRLSEHNAGKSPHTGKFKPWRLVTYVAFSDRAKALSFEQYLKSGSGHALRQEALVVARWASQDWRLDPPRVPHQDRATKYEVRA
jgi:predicted GIY-YIG superfamily endonuclease